MPGVRDLNPKGRVNKDLVIWQQPAQTCWDDRWAVVHEPLAILEWKVFRTARQLPGFSAHDVRWLRAFSRGRSRFVGYAVWLDLERRGPRLAAGRIHQGTVDLDWLRL